MHVPCSLFFLIVGSRNRILSLLRSRFGQQTISWASTKPHRSKLWDPYFINDCFAGSQSTIFKHNPDCLPILHGSLSAKSITIIFVVVFKLNIRKFQFLTQQTYVIAYSKYNWRRYISLFVWYYNVCALLLRQDQWTNWSFDTQRNIQRFQIKIWITKFCNYKQLYLFLNWDCNIGTKKYYGWYIQ